MGIKFTFLEDHIEMYWAPEKYMFFPNEIAGKLY